LLSLVYQEKDAIVAVSLHRVSIFTIFWATLCWYREGVWYLIYVEAFSVVFVLIPNIPNII
jgi:hypothetical protein